MNNITKSKTMLFKTPSTEHDMILYVLFSDYHLSDWNLKNLYNNYWSTELLPISETQLLFTKKLFIINSITTKWSLYLYTLFNYVTANINSKLNSKKHTKHDKSISAVIELLVLNEKWWRNDLVFIFFWALYRHTF